MKDEYVIMENFETDPEESGWYEEPDLERFQWEEELKILSGRIDDDNRYIRYLSKFYDKTDILEFKTMVHGMIEWVSPDPRAIGLMGFGKKDTPTSEAFVGLEIKHEPLTIRIRINDEVSTEGLEMELDEKLVLFFRYVPEDNKAYLSSYDQLTGQPLEEISMDIALEVDFKVNQTGIFSEDGAYWHLMVYYFNSIRIYETIYSGLYCTPEEARKLTNLDAAKDMSDNMFAQLIKIYSMPQVNSRFRAEGYRTPFYTDERTPPLIRTIAALLTAAYAGKKSYTGHSQNENPVYKELLKEVNDLFEGLSYGDYELLDVDGSIINRSLHTSTDMRSTTEGRTGIFSLDDVPDITELIKGGRIIDGK